MILCPVSKNDQILGLNIFTDQIRIGRTDKYLSLFKQSFSFTDHYGSVQRIRNMAKRCSRLRKRTGILIHHTVRNITYGNDTFQMIILICQRQCHRVKLLHKIPCLSHRNLFGNSRQWTDLHILYLRSHIRKISRCSHFKILQHIFRFFIHLTGTFCHKRALFCMVFQICQSYGGTDGICIRIFMAKNINSVLFTHVFVLRRIVFPKFLSSYHLLSTGSILPEINIHNIS